MTEDHEPFLYPLGITGVNRIVLHSDITHTTLEAVGLLEKSLTICSFSIYQNQSQICFI